MKAAYKKQYRQEILNYDYIDMFDALRLSNEYYKGKLTIRERIDIYKSVFEY
tara:strand:- start:3527 stop:3682 length:156 start_codon:yes stop_codon:yes gene_type:complete